MKHKLLPFLVVISILGSCGSSKKFQASFTEDKPLFQAINELNKRPGSTKAQADLKVLYNNSIERHEEAIAVYKTSVDENKWDMVLRELNALQYIYTSLQATPGSFSIVKPKNYLRDVEDVKQWAAEDYYARAQQLMENDDRQSSLEAWQLFKRSNEYVSGYKDVAKQIRDSYERSIINVVINPIEDDNIFFSNGSWNTADVRYRPEDYQEQLIRELGGKAATYTPARFFNERDARRERLPVDLDVSMRWRSIRPIQSAPRQYTRKVSKSVEQGKDSTGKPAYQTVYATLNISENNYRVQGDFEYRIVNRESKNAVDNGTLNNEISWADNSATYTGDSRALSASDWTMVNNRGGFNQPSRSEVMNSLMKKIFPDLKRRIQNAIQ